MPGCGMSLLRRNRIVLPLRTPADVTATGWLLLLVEFSPSWPRLFDPQA